MGKQAMARDRAVCSLFTADRVTLGLAWLQGGGLLALLWPYFPQNLAMGYFAGRRLRALQDFCTQGLQCNGRHVSADSAGRDDSARLPPSASGTVRRPAQRAPGNARQRDHLDAAQRVLVHAESLHPAARFAYRRCWRGAAAQ